MQGAQTVDEKVYWVRRLIAEPKFNEALLVSVQQHIFFFFHFSSNTHFPAPDFNSDSTRTFSLSLFVATICSHWELVIVYENGEMANGVGVSSFLVRNRIYSHLKRTV